MNIGEGRFSLATWNSTFNWTRTAMSLKFPTFSRRFRTLLSLGGPILYGLVGSLGHARLTAIKSAFGIDIKQSTPLCQNFGPRKSNLHPFLFYPIKSKLYFFEDINFCIIKNVAIIWYLSLFSTWMLDKKLDMNGYNFWTKSFADFHRCNQLYVLNICQRDN